MTEIKSCPFCGGEFISIRMVRLNRRSGYRASCNGCGITQRGIVHPSIEAAKEAWNRRSETEQQAEPVAWQTMETCPEEGEFLVYIPSERPEKRMQVAQWRKNVKIIGHIFHFDSRPPTHWHPLPAGPGAEI